MKTGTQIQKEAEAESIKVLGEVNKDFIIGYLSASIALLENGKAFKKGFDEGFEAGFTCAEIASTSIIEAQDKFDQIDNSTDPSHPAPDSSKDLAANAGAGSVHPIFQEILNTLSNVHGSGYEGRRK